MRKTLITLLASAAATFAFVAPASASTRGVHPSVPQSNSTSTAFHQVCQHSSPLLCLRDPSDGGAGTPVKMSGYGGDESENWSFFISSSACNNTGKVESGCGLPSFLVNRYGGDDIVVFKQENSGDCIKFSSATHWLGTMGTCDDNNTLLIFASCNSQSYCYYPSIAASEASNQVQWMCGNAEGGQPFTGNGCADITWGLFPSN